MIIFNSTIIYKFLKTKYQNRYADSQSTSQALVKSSTKGTAMLLTVSSTFIIFSAPISIGLATSAEGSPNSTHSNFPSRLLKPRYKRSPVLYCWFKVQKRIEESILLCSQESSICQWWSNKSECSVRLSSIFLILKFDKWICNISHKIVKQQYIPVGCVPSAAVAISGGRSG